MTMSFFGKLKNLHSGPPTPPKRIENNAGYDGWPEDEFDEEDGDTYEVPPCERPAMNVPSRHVEENVYLERKSERSNPVLPKRQAAAPPRPAKMVPMGKALQPHPEEFYIDPNTKKPPEVDRKEKPGKRSTPKKFASPPPPAEEDVYLDPNEGQEDSDDLYLEPTAAMRVEKTLVTMEVSSCKVCPPAPRGPIRMPLPPKTAAAPPPMPITRLCFDKIKPPVPRAKSSSILVNEAKTAPPPDIRRSMFPGKLPPPTLGIKPPLPASLKEPKPSPPPPPIVHSTAAVSPPGMKTTMQEKEWFAGNCDRKTAEDFLLQINKDGAFLIRHSSAQNARQPYTLAVLYRQKVYNIPIRFLEETRGYALGKEGKKNEEFFCSLQEIISHHKNNQLLLIDSKSQAKHTTHLTHPACP
ncbi:B-cell linker protein-like isoform X2 [Oncorhynchus masou masou]|uniref:B-cell linker protein-like isoform X2 n=1 Tax=Oncorhynchus masou masou TaxID=90313 RepID=UPI003182C749